MHLGEPLIIWLAYYLGVEEAEAMEAEAVTEAVTEAVIAMAVAVAEGVATTGNVTEVIRSFK